jgi:hypothetical protein
VDSGQLLLSWKSWFVHLLATAQMYSVSGPFSHAAGTGTLQRRAGPLFLRYRRVDLLLGSDLCCFCAGWCRDHLDPGLGAYAAATSPFSTKTSYGTARHTLARQRELPPVKEYRPATTQEWANSGGTSIQQLTRGGYTQPVADGLTSHSRWPRPTGQWPGRTWRSALMVVPRRRRTRARRVLVFL